jgi:sulfate transport system permease protein
MKTTAAILWEVNAPWSVEEIELDAPKAGEVLVKIAASGMCHSDEHLTTGDLPFALPTAVAGISLTALLAGNGWIGQYLEPLGIQLAFNRNGVLIALIFIGLPFVVRTVQPILEDVEKELEEAATCLGATRWQTFSRVIFPALAPALLTGFAMAFARAIGEYGSVIFIAGNMPMVSEITPLIIISKLEQYDYAGATAVALVMLLAAFIMLLLINGLQAWQRARSGASS